MTGLSIASLPAAVETVATAEPGAGDPARATRFAGLLAGKDVPPTKVAPSPAESPVEPVSVEPSEPAGEETDPVPADAPTDPVLSLPIMGAAPLIPVPLVVVPAPAAVSITAPATARSIPSGSSLTVAEGVPSPLPPPPAPPHAPFATDLPVPGQPIALDGPTMPRAGFGGRPPVEEPPTLPVVTLPAAPVSAPPVATPPSAVPPGTRLPMQPSPDMPDVLPNPDEPPAGSPVTPSAGPIAIDGPVRPTRLPPVQGPPDVPDNVVTVQDVPVADISGAPPAPAAMLPAAVPPVVAADAPDLVLVDQAVPPSVPGVTVVRDGRQTSPAAPALAAASKSGRGLDPAVVAAAPVESTLLRRNSRPTGDTRTVDISAVPLPATTAAIPDQAPTATAAPLADRAVAHRLDMAAGDRWLDQLARDIAQTAGNDAQLKFRLNPEHLGSLQVELRHTAEGASIRLSADTEAARAILADARPRLLAEAQAQGVRIADAQVSGGNGQSSRQGEGQRPQPPVVPQPLRTSPRNVATVTVNEPIGAIAERYA